MARGRSNFIMGTVELIILYLLDKQDLYGYQLSPLISRLSDGRLDITESTLYPALYKLLDNGFISDRRVQAGKRRVRVYYHMEAKGAQRLADLLEDYRVITDGLAAMLSAGDLPAELTAAPADPADDKASAYGIDSGAGGAAKHD